MTKPDDKPPIDGSALDTADRPRQRISRDQGQALTDRIFDALEAAGRANDPETRQRHENTAHALRRQLNAGIFGDLQARRNAAAAASRTVIEPQVWNDATVEAGNGAIDPAALNNPFGAMHARNVLCRMLLDNSELLPPGLAHHTVKALYLITTGERDTWLTRSPKGGGVAHHVAIAEIAQVYYRAGFYFLDDLAKAAAELFSDDPSRWSTLEKFRTRHSDLQVVFDDSKGIGAADAAAGRPYSVPLAGDYTISQLKALRSGSRGKSGRKGAR